MIGIGPNSRALGGTGIASAQDAVSAVFSNPAVMCLSESCSQPQFDFSLTTFMPKVNSTFGGINAKSDSDLYFIPALGVSLPVGGEGSHWRAGFAIYGVSGLGVDYQNAGFSAGIPFDYTELQILKIAPSVAYAVTPDISIGASMHIQYASLEIGSHNTFLPPGAPPMAGKYDDTDWAMGLQLGATWKISECLTAGLTYTTAQKNDFDDVMPNPGGPVDFSLEAPQQAGAGISWVGLKDRLTLSGDIKWFNWSDAAGYSDFGWNDQWTFGVGAQYEVIEDKLVVRVGYNYGESPVESIDAMTDMGGLIGFPAIVEHHVTLGMGYQINEKFILNLSWVHAFENTVKSDYVAGLESTMYQDTIDVGLSWRF